MTVVLAFMLLALDRPRTARNPAIPAVESSPSSLARFPSDDDRRRRTVAAPGTRNVEEIIDAPRRASARIYGVAATPGTVEAICVRLGRDGLRERYRVKTRDDGSWSIDDVEVRHDGGAVEVVRVSLRSSSARRVLAERFAVEAGEDREATDPWGGERPLTVVLRYPGGGLVAAGLAVCLGPPDAPRGDWRLVTRFAEGTTDALGRVDFGPVPTGRYAVRVGAVWDSVSEQTTASGGSNSFTGSRLVTAYGELGLTAGIEHDGRSVPTIVVDGRGPLTGRALDSRGLPSPNALVRVHTGDEVMFIDTADAGGEFHLHLVPVDSTILLCARRQAGGDGPFVEARAGDRGVILTVEDE
ncbi:MAG: hypothetical protein AAF726_07640 [Planctomycetota bacterium]